MATATGAPKDVEMFAFGPVKQTRYYVVFLPQYPGADGTVTRHTVMPVTLAGAFVAVGTPEHVHH